METKIRLERGSAPTNWKPDELEEEPGMIEIRDPTAADEVAWRCLWNGYLSFYEIMIPEEVTAETWRRILDPSCRFLRPLGGAEEQGRRLRRRDAPPWDVVGETRLLSGRFVLVAHDGRGSGAGRALIEDLITHSRRTAGRRSTGRRARTTRRPAGSTTALQPPTASSATRWNSFKANCRVSRSPLGFGIVH